MSETRIWDGFGLFCTKSEPLPCNKYFKIHLQNVTTNDETGMNDRFHHKKD